MRPEYYEKLTDDELVALSHEQDETATETLMSRYKGMVRNRARSMFILGGESEDLIQEGMIMTAAATQALQPLPRSVFPVRCTLLYRPPEEKSTCL